MTSGDFLAISFGQLAFAIYKFCFTMGYPIFSSGYGHKNPERPLIMVLSQGIFFQGVNLQLPLSWCGRLNIFFSGFSYYFFSEGSNWLRFNWATPEKIQTEQIDMEF